MYQQQQQDEEKKSQSLDEVAEGWMKIGLPGSSAVDVGVFVWNIENVLDRPLRLLFMKLAVACDDANSDAPDDAVDVTFVVVTVVVVLVTDDVDANEF